MDVSVTTICKILSEKYKLRSRWQKNQQRGSIPAAQAARQGGTDGPNPGLIPPEELDALVDQIHTNSNRLSRKATGAAASNLDPYQVNCTFYDALGRNDRDHLLARAIQFFAPGVPQVYYVGLLAGENDMTLLAKSGFGRDINRHYYTPEEINLAIQRPVVQSLFELIHFRNQRPAFDGSFSMPDTRESGITMRWDNGANWAMLDVDFASGLHSISNSPFELLVPKKRDIERPQGNGDNISTLYNSLTIGIIEKCSQNYSFLRKITQHKCSIVCIPALADITVIRLCLVHVLRQ